MGRLVLIGGGVRTGKSRFALERARDAGLPATYIATAELLDDEMRARARAHRAERDAGFETFEEPLDPAGALAASPHRTVVVDCLTLWLSNLLLRGAAPEDILREVDRLGAAALAGQRTVILVTNEVGLGIVPEHRLGRVFRDVAGAAHQRLAAIADEVWFGALGLLLRLKPGPVEARSLSATGARPAS